MTSKGNLLLRPPRHRYAMASTPARRTLLLTMLLLLSAFSSNSTFRQAELESIGDPLEVTEGRATANQGVWAVLPPTRNAF